MSNKIVLRFRVNEAIDKPVLVDKNETIAKTLSVLCKKNMLIDWNHMKVISVKHRSLGTLVDLDLQKTWNEHKVLDDDMVYVYTAIKGYESSDSQE